MNINVFLVTVILLSIYIVRTRTNEIVLNDVDLKISDENSQGVYSDNTNNNIQSLEGIALERINLRKRDVFKHTISRRSAKMERVSRSTENHKYPSSPPPRDTYPRVQSSNSKPNYPHGYNLSYAEVKPSHHARDSASLKQNIPHNVNASYPSSPTPTSPRFNNSHRHSNNPHNSSQKENSTHGIHSHPSRNTQLQNMSSVYNNSNDKSFNPTTVPTMSNRSHLTTSSRFDINNSTNFGNHIQFNSTNSRLEPMNVTTTPSLLPFTSSYSNTPQYFYGDLTTEKSKVEFINNTSISPFTSKPLFLNFTTHLNSTQSDAKPILFTTPTPVISPKPAYTISDTYQPNQPNNKTLILPNSALSYPVSSTPYNYPNFPVTTLTPEQIKSSNSLPLYLPNVLLSYPPVPQISNNTQEQKLNNFSSNANISVSHVNNNINQQIFNPKQSFSNPTFIPPNNQNDPFIHLETPKPNYPSPITENQSNLIPSNLIPYSSSISTLSTIPGSLSPNNTLSQSLTYPQSLNLSYPLTTLPPTKINGIQNQPQSYMSNQNPYPTTSSPLPTEPWTPKLNVTQNLLNIYPQIPISSYPQLNSPSINPNSAQSQPHSYPPSQNPHPSSSPAITPWDVKTNIQQNQPHIYPQNPSPSYPQATLLPINLSSTQSQPHLYPLSPNTYSSTSSPLPTLPWTPMPNISQNQPHIYSQSSSSPYPLTILPSKNTNTIYNQSHSYPPSSTYNSSTSSSLLIAPWTSKPNIPQNQHDVYPQSLSPSYPQISLPSNQPSTTYNQPNSYPPSSNTQSSISSPHLTLPWTPIPNIPQNQTYNYQQNLSSSYPPATLTSKNPNTIYNQSHSYPPSSTSSSSISSPLLIAPWISKLNIPQNQPDVYPQSLSPSYPQTTLPSNKPNTTFNQPHSYPPSPNTHSSTLSPLPNAPWTLVPNIPQNQPHIYPQSPNSLLPQTTLPSKNPNIIYNQPHSYPPSSNPYSSISSPLPTAPWTPKPNNPQSQFHIYPQSPSPSYLLTTLPPSKLNAQNQPLSYPSTPKPSSIWPKDTLNTTQSQPHSYPPSPKTTTSFMTTTSKQVNPTIKNSKLKNSSNNIHVTNIVVVFVGLYLLRLVS